MNSAREVVSLRLSAEEKGAIEEAARERRITPSDFLRQAALLVAHRLREAAKPKPVPVRAAPDPPADDGPHVTRTYRSLAEYKQGGFGEPRDYSAEAARIIEQAG